MNKHLEPFMGYPINTLNEEKELKILFTMSKYKIMETMKDKIKLLENIDIAIIADDSTSMETKTEYGTRWKELNTFINICVDVVSCVNNNGVDIYFLNKNEPIRNVTDITQIAHLQNMRPYGCTPLAQTLQKILIEKSMSNKLLVLIITDGEPTDTLGSGGKKEINNFKNILKHKNKNVFVNILACTTNDSVMDYLNDWDKDIDNFDVTDDYESEKKEILKAKGANFEFTYGTYVLKTVIGSLDPSIDNLDESSDDGCNNEKEKYDCVCNIM